MKPLNGRVILKELKEKKKIKGLLIPQQVLANQLTFAKVVAIPDKSLDTKNLKVGDYVVLGYSPIWEKKYKYKVDNEYYLVVSEYAILAIINDSEVLDLVDTEEVK